MLCNFLFISKWKKNFLELTYAFQIYLKKKKKKSLYEKLKKSCDKVFITTSGSIKNFLLRKKLS